MFKSLLNIVMDTMSMNTAWSLSILVIKQFLQV